MIYSSKNYNYPSLIHKIPGNLSGLLPNNEFWTLETIFKNLEICSSTNDVNQAKIFPLDIHYLPHAANILNVSKFFGKKIINKLISGQAKLVINYLHEANHRYHIMGQNFDELYQKLEQAGIPNESILYLTGDLQAEETFIKNRDRIKILGLDIFEYICSRKWYQKSKIISKFSLDKPHAFLYLNGSPRPHRCVFKHYLERSNILEDSIYSWLHYHPVPTPSDIKIFLDRNKIDLYDPKEVRASALKIRTLDVEEHYVPRLRSFQQRVQNDWFEKTIFSLVSETYVEDNAVFITEKTYKPIAYGHPFMIYGNPGTLEVLKRRGFETFPELFDESYDSKYPMMLRYEFFKSNIYTFKEKASGKEKIINDKIKHNYDLFFQKPHEKTIKQVLTRLLESI